MPILDSYLFFNGNCAEAMRFYEQALGGRMEASMTYAQGPEPERCAPQDKDLIMHCSLKVGDRTLMASDVPAHMGGAQKMAGFSLSLTYPTADEARQVFEALSGGGTVMMPMQKTFWAEAFGMFTDRFGTPWMVSGGAQS